jgi:2-iminobutanoate/2-iminopropanoate deaminase
LEQRVVATEKAPAAIGPYSQGIAAGGFVFTAGQIALIPGEGRLLEGDAAAQAEQVLANLRAVLEAAGSTLDVV